MPARILFVTLLAAGVVWLHWRFVVTPLDYANKDFMSLWTGGKALWRGLNPYDPAVWGPLRAEYGSRWFPDPRAPFPLWTFLLTAPFALLPLPWAAAAWLTFGEGLLALSLFWLLRERERATLAPVDLGLLVVGAFLSPATILALINGQLTFVLLACLALGVVYAGRGEEGRAGIFLAAILLKPNPFILFAPLLGLWLLWQRRWRTIAAALLTTIVLFLITWLIQPGWLFDWLNVTEKAAVVTITPTLWGLAAEWGGSAWWLVGLLLTIALTAGVGLAVFRPPRLPDAAVYALALAASLLVTPYVWTYEHVLLYLPWTAWYARQSSAGRARLGWLAQTLLVPWVVFLLAVVRVNDVYGLVVPLLTLLVEVGGMRYEV